MRRRSDRPSPAVVRGATALVAAGAVAIAVSQLHIMPPMLCFAMLVAGILAVGGAVLLIAKRYLVVARHPRPRRMPDTAGGQAAHPDVAAGVRLPRCITTPRRAGL